MPNTQNNSVKTLRQVVADSIDSFLLQEGFVLRRGAVYRSEVPKAILNIIDAVSNYYEEGQLLFPEVLITQKIELVLSLTFNKRIQLGKENISEDSFKLAMKLAAPLCKDGWAIYCNLNDDTIEYGIISTEISSTSLTLLQQLKDSETTREDGACFAYIRRRTASSVEIQGYNTNNIIEFSLSEAPDNSTNHISIIVEAITSGTQIESESNLSFHTYIDNLLSEAIRNGHGNLIGVINKEPDNIEKVKDHLTGGIFFDKPIDLFSLLKDLEAEKTLDSDFSLRIHSSLIKSMVNNDGIVLFNTIGQVVGYHLLIPDVKKEPEASDQPPPKHIGGSRTRAFKSMKSCGLFAAGFFKSQDGKEDSF